MVFSLPDRLCLRSEITLMHIVAADVVSSVAGHTPTYYSDKEYLSKSSYSLCKFSRSIFSLSLRLFPILVGGREVCAVSDFKGYSTSYDCSNYDLKKAFGLR